jgi:hypothetical protein
VADHGKNLEEKISKIQAAQNGVFFRIMLMYSVSTSCSAISILSM